MAFIGSLLILTARIGWCPLSRMFGVSTCRYPVKIKGRYRRSNSQSQRLILFRKGV
ncbi:MAG: DUF2892 domain-containing protein [Deltaproteobacteria bacterium]|nr:DUF2892 domain-containing protein [Deltaproteobacteria bacterium]